MANTVLDEDFWQALRANDDEWSAEDAHNNSEGAHTPGREHLRIFENKGPVLVITRGDKVEPVSVDWIWDGWLAAGKMALIGGAPGCGKSTITAALGAVISNGGRWPDGSRAEQGNVVVWSGEDGVDDTLAPRFRAAGADMSRVFFISGVKEKGVTYPFDPSKDMQPLENALQAIDDVRLLIVDPIVSATSGDSHKNTEVRRGLQPLVDLAMAARCSLLGVTHFSKGTQGRDPVERITGSLAFGALARLVMVAATGEPKEGKPDERLLVRAKSNLGPNGGGFTYDVSYGPLPSHPDVIASHVTWGKPVEGTARSLLEDAESMGTGNPARDGAKEWLLSELAGGPIASDIIKADALAAGYTASTIRRAKDGIVKPYSEGNGTDKKWYWKLIGQSHEFRRCEDAHEKEVSTFENTVSTYGEEIRSADEYRRAAGGE